MRKTKKGMLLAGSIIAIVAALSMLITGFVMLVANNIVDSNFVYDIYVNDPAYTIDEQLDGSFIIYDKVTGEVELDSEDIDMVVDIVKTIFVAAGVVLLVLAAADATLGILILVNTCKNKFKKGLTIGLLVCGVFTGSILVIGFMIAALCIKDKVEIKDQTKSNNDVETIVVE